jgi:UDPglucose--hexose-1-phosphate uridylyltransferase
LEDTRILPELRKDPITGRWVLIATDRAKRPGDFSREASVLHGPENCPLCAHHEHKTPPEILAYRIGGNPNEPGWTLRVVPHKFPALRIEGELTREGEGLYDKMNGVGAHEIIIESPDHVVSLGDLSDKRVEDLFWAFRDRINDLKKDHRLRYAILFKNHGESAGASLEHTHSQLIALPVVPNGVQQELEGARRYFEFKDRCVYCDIVRQELDSSTRLILETEQFVVIAPYASRYPFETWILPRHHDSHFENAQIATIQGLGAVLRTVVRKFDKVLERPAYNMVVHNAPLQEPPMEHFHWYIELVPKLTRVGGFELGTGFHVNPTPPEEAASYLKQARV